MLIPLGQPHVCLPVPCSKLDYFPIVLCYHCIQFLSEISLCNNAIVFFTVKGCHIPPCNKQIPWAQGSWISLEIKCSRAFFLKCCCQRCVKRQLDK